MRCGAPLNWTGWCNRDLEAALDRGAATLDPARRKAAYHQVNELWMRDLPYMVAVSLHLVLGAERQR